MKLEELNVLVVEDDDFQRSLITGMVRALGVASVSGAGDGQQALERIRAVDGGPVHVALCDLNMPGMDGLEFLRHLGQERHAVAIVILSALDSKVLSSVVRMTRMYGIRLLGAIEKPIRHDHLKDLLEKLEGPAAMEWQPAPARAYGLQEILLGVQAEQFEPYFQPKLDLQTGRLVGAEALARWMHPEAGVIGPYAFIPQLERGREIDALTFQMIEKAALAGRVFRECGHDITVSVNLSLTSLDDPTLADRITQRVRASGLDPNHLVLEITESAAMTEVAHALENLARLCMNGFPLSIDDYGTGYSSLQQLTRIAFSELKIDQSFVKEFSENEALRIVVESSIEMAHKLRAKSVAEGVESRQDWEALKGMGCDTAQGYYIAKPMDMDAFLAFCDAHQGA